MCKLMCGCLLDWCPKSYHRVVAILGSTVLIVAAMQTICTDLCCGAMLILTIAMATLALPLITLAFAVATLAYPCLSANTHASVSVTILAVARLAPQVGLPNVHAFIKLQTLKAKQIFRR